MRNKTPVEILTKKDRYGKILGYEGDRKDLTTWEATGQLDPTRMSDTPYDLMNAREIPVAREFWDVNWKVGRTFGFRFDNLAEAMDCWRKCADQMEIIHVREVLAGDGE